MQTPRWAAFRLLREGHGLWRGLALFWLVVLLGIGGTIAVLAWMGAPTETAPRVLVAPPPTAQAPAPPVLAQPAPAPSPPALAEATPSTAPEPPAVTSPAPAPAPLPLTLPEAPEPPPLPEAVAAVAPQPIAAPDPALLEDSGAGPLPRIAEDGRQPRLVYARAFDRADTRPRIGLILPAAPEQALRRLPGEIALAYREAPQPLLAAARARGMETLLLLPPVAEPGALDTALARFSGYVGVLGAPGGGRESARTQDILRKRGLLYLDAATDSTAPIHAWGRSADLMLNNAPTRGEVDRQLRALENIAREAGSALGVLPEAPSPLWLDRVAGWAASLPERGLVLAPVSAMIRRPASAQR
ncbi:hypothetical protein HMPREF9946_00071 [Acetobacteraceae bacterium AT-5844]|nr:hypothetical protein HMPREF9946_00071 [Acetobacteraceae bacterium AT-5844]